MQLIGYYELYKPFGGPNKVKCHNISYL